MKTQTLTNPKIKTLEARQSPRGQAKPHASQSVHIGTSGNISTAGANILRLAASSSAAMSGLFSGDPKHTTNQKEGSANDG
jgi:hypothetical protein